MTCEEVKNKILDLIAEQQFEPGSKMPAFRALARKFEASIPTVQRAISMLVSEGILISKVGSGTYVSERRNNKSRLIGILLPYTGMLGDNFLAVAQHRMREVFQQNGYIPVIVYPQGGTRGEERMREELFLIEQLMSQEVAGLIVGSASDVDSPFWRKLRFFNLPIVCFNNIGRAADQFDFVASDNEQGGVLAAERLIEAGKVPAIILADQLESDAVSRRVRGFCATFADAGLPAPEVVNLDSCFGSSTLIGDRLLEKIKKHKGVFAVNDTYAVKTLTALRDDGVKVPEEIAVIGFDDGDICEHVTPRLDSIRQSAGLMGEKAARLLLDRIAAGDAILDTMHIKVKVSLTKRESVAP